jgi:hypothetical protein
VALCRFDVLRTRQQVNPDVPGQHEVVLAVDAGVRERRGLASTPVLNRCVRVENLRALIEAISGLEPGARPIDIARLSPTDLR